MINIVLFGPPGSGKGTQAKRIVKEFNFKHISTGDLFRYHLKNDTSLGREAKLYLNYGKLVPDRLTSLMLADEINKNLNTVGFIFDGYPRTINQANYLDKLLFSLGSYVYFTILLNVDKQVSINRLLERGKTSGRTDDINSKIIYNRIREYYQKTLEVANFYKKQNKLIQLNGTDSIYKITDKIFQEIKKIL